jgi:hypothetical protein
MKRSSVLSVTLGAMLGVAGCVAPGIQGPGGSVQGTANVEQLERGSAVTPPSQDYGNAANAAFYGEGRRYYPGYYYGPCGPGPCYRPYRW